jgi:hypothetical protein
MARQRGLLVRTAALDVNHPAIYEGMCRVGAKLALATYYAERGKPASASAVINCQWSHSQHSTNVFNSVKTLLTALQNQRDLKQGEWVTTDTFYLKYSDEGTLLIAAIFHESVALLASVHESRQAFNASGERLWHHLMAPSPGNGIVKLI